MLTITSAINKAEHVVKKYGRISSHSLCNSLGILIMPYDFGDSPDSVKGFIICSNNQKCITYNSSLPNNLQELIIIHEIGHALLHNVRLENSFVDKEICREADIKEKEANIFAAEYLISDDIIKENVRNGLTFFDISKLLMLPEGLLYFKFLAMTEKGYHFHTPPIFAKNNFLSNLN